MSKIILEVHLGIIWEITSSGIGKHPDTKPSDPHNSADQGFVSMEFDTTTHNEKVTVKIHKQNGVVRTTETKVINLADIR